VGNVADIALCTAGTMTKQQEEGCHGEHDGTGKVRPLLRGQNRMTAPQLLLIRIVPVIAHAIATIW